MTGMQRSALLLSLLLPFINSLAAYAGSPGVTMRPEIWSNPLANAEYPIKLPFYVGVHLINETGDSVRNHMLMARVYRDDQLVFEDQVGDHPVFKGETSIKGVWEERDFTTRHALVPNLAGNYRVDFILTDSTDDSYDSLSIPFRIAAKVTGKVSFALSRIDEFLPRAGAMYDPDDSIAVRVLITNGMNVTAPYVHVWAHFQTRAGRNEYENKATPTGLRPGETREVTLPTFYMNRATGLNKCFEFSLHMDISVIDSIGGCIDINYKRPAEVDLALSEPGTRTAEPHAGEIRLQWKYEDTVFAALRNPSLRSTTLPVQVRSTITGPTGNLVNRGFSEIVNLQSKPELRIPTSMILRYPDIGVHTIKFTLSHREVPFDSVSWTFRVISDTTIYYSVLVVTEGEKTIHPTNGSIYRLGENIPIDLTVFSTNPVDSIQPVFVSAAVVDKTSGNQVYYTPLPSFPLAPLEERRIQLPPFYPSDPGTYRLSLFLVAARTFGTERFYSEFVVEEPTSSTDTYTSSKPGVSVAPNPTVGDREIGVEIVDDGRFTISLHDILGRRVSEPIHARVEGRARVPLRIDGQPAGMYLVRVSAGSGETVDIPLTIRR